ncbi:hypothetical protein Taro_006944 [Colocasia esculenta]|uniref:Uncharacterized protein n=1 Tax=Colocasia esculenta TaxID=4460 RepID=A0A843TWS5_COLES|nr:hypothetical protein [Colocasia esculenta]
MELFKMVVQMNFKLRLDRQFGSVDRLGSISEASKWPDATVILVTPCLCVAFLSLPVNRMRQSSVALVF